MTAKPELKAHLFICTHSREKGASCIARGSEKLSNQVKALSKDPARNWKGIVRVNSTGCLGRCEEGITAVLYPSTQWMTQLNPESADELLEAISKKLDNKE